VPPDAEVEDARPGGLDLASQCRHLVPGLALLDEVEHGDAVDDDEVRPGGLAHGAHGLDREPAALLGGASPGVRAVVGPGREELVDEVALGPHDLDTVIAGLARAGGGGRDIGDLLLDPRRVECLGRVWRDRRTDRRGRDGARGIGIAAGMKDLHRDPATGRVHGAGHDPMVGDVLGGVEPRGAG